MSLEPLKPYFPWITLVALVLIVGIINPAFFNIGSLVTLVADIVPLFIMALGMTFAIYIGGIDLSATLASSQVIENYGFFQSPCIALLPMAERCPPALAAKLAALADQSLTQGFLALDEGIEPDERTPDAPADRLASHLAPKGPAPAGTRPPVPAGTAFAKTHRTLILPLS